jgi:NAD(P)H-hydrate repair Nnr-like enzyme with NAD(P)H-hydrate dehydratase domain
VAKKTKTINQHLRQIEPFSPESHKGENGKLLIIGGSHLFHAASKWSLDIASKFVDMVFYASTPENNQLIKEAKQNFWNGIVVPRAELENYLKEADCILIGPGMERQPQKPLN